MHPSRASRRFVVVTGRALALLLAGVLTPGLLAGCAFHGDASKSVRSQVVHLPGVTAAQLVTPAGTDTKIALSVTIAAAASSAQVTALVSHYAAVTKKAHYPTDQVQLVIVSGANHARVQGFAAPALDIAGEAERWWSMTRLDGTAGVDASVLTSPTLSLSTAYALTLTPSSDADDVVDAYNRLEARWPDSGQRSWSVVVPGGSGLGSTYGYPGSDNVALWRRLLAAGRPLATVGTTAVVLTANRALETQGRAAAAGVATYVASVQVASSADEPLAALGVPTTFALFTAAGRAELDALDATRTNFQFSVGLGDQPAAYLDTRQCRQRPEQNRPLQNELTAYQLGLPRTRALCTS